MFALQSDDESVSPSPQGYPIATAWLEQQNRFLVPGTEFSQPEAPIEEALEQLRGKPELFAKVIRGACDDESGDCKAVDEVLSDDNLSLFIISRTPVVSEAWGGVIPTLKVLKELRESSERRSAWALSIQNAKATNEGMGFVHAIMSDTGISSVTSILNDDFIARLKPRVKLGWYTRNPQRLRVKLDGDAPQLDVEWAGEDVTPTLAVDVYQKHFAGPRDELSIHDLLQDRGSVPTDKLWDPDWLIWRLKSFLGISDDRLKTELSSPPCKEWRKKLVDQIFTTDTNTAWRGTFGEDWVGASNIGTRTTQCRASGKSFAIMVLRKKPTDHEKIPKFFYIKHGIWDVSEGKAINEEFTPEWPTAEVNRQKATEQQLTIIGKNCKTLHGLCRDPELTEPSMDDLVREDVKRIKLLYKASDDAVRAVGTATGRATTPYTIAEDVEAVGLSDEKFKIMPLLNKGNLRQIAADRRMFAEDRDNTLPRVASTSLGRGWLTQYLDSGSPEETLKTIIGSVRDRADSFRVLASKDWNQVFTSLPEKGQWTKLKQNSHLAKELGITRENLLTVKIDLRSKLSELVRKYVGELGDASPPEAEDKSLRKEVRDRAGTSQSAKAFLEAFPLQLFTVDPAQAKQVERKLREGETLYAPLTYEGEAATYAQKTLETVARQQGCEGILSEDYVWNSLTAYTPCAVLVGELAGIFKQTDLKNRITEGIASVVREAKKTITPPILKAAKALSASTEPLGQLMAAKTLQTRVVAAQLDPRETKDVKMVTQKMTESLTRKRARRTAMEAEEWRQKRLRELLPGPPPPPPPPMEYVLEENPKDRADVLAELRRAMDDANRFLLHKPLRSPRRNRM